MFGHILGWTTPAAIWNQHFRSNPLHAHCFCFASGFLFHHEGNVVTFLQAAPQHFMAGVVRSPHPPNFQHIQIRQARGQTFLVVWSLYQTLKPFDVRCESPFSMWVNPLLRGTYPIPKSPCLLEWWLNKSVSKLSILKRAKHRSPSNYCWWKKSG